jgi:protein associated with RNAse G/E
MKSGDTITVRALHADGHWYRRWRTTIESIDTACIVTVSPPNNTSEDIERGARTLRWAIRTFYWFDKPYNLLELYSAEGVFEEVYVNVASPARWVGDELHFEDYELDISKKPGQPGEIIDEDEFEEAIVKFGYTSAFIAHCRRAAQDALILAETWQPKGAPIL